MSKYNNNNEKTGQSSSQSSSHWAELMAELFDRLTGKGASVTYSFENFVVDIPKAVGPRGQELGSAKWTVNGKIQITAESHRSTVTD